MADLYELVLALDLRADLAPDELAELRWHVGLGERPATLVLGTDASLDTYAPEEPGGEWVTAEPEPVLGQTGPAWRIGGALVAVLVPHARTDGWALTARQEVHPDQFPALRPLLEWLGRWAAHDGYAGHLRFYENDGSTPLVVHNGQMRLPDAIGQA